MLYSGVLVVGFLRFGLLVSIMRCFAGRVRFTGVFNGRVGSVKTNGVQAFSGRTASLLEMGALLLFFIIGHLMACDFDGVSM